MAEPASPRFRTIVGPTPALSTPGFPFNDLSTFKAALQRNYLFKSTELVLLPGDRVQVLEKASEHIRRVKMDRYPDLVYIDIRMSKAAAADTPDRIPKLPPREQILAFLRNAVGTPYVWGGNFKDGISHMFDLYPPGQKFDDPLVEVMWTYRGVDCTGLLYQATDGYTPRNSGDLAKFGQVLPVEGMTIAQICPLLHPLDLAVWRGHVFIYLGNDQVVESRWPSEENFATDMRRGVVITPVWQRFEELFQMRRPINDPLKLDPQSFVITRWYP